MAKVLREGGKSAQKEGVFSGDRRCSGLGEDELGEWIERAVR